MKITDDMIHAGALAADVTLTEARKVIEVALAAAPKPEPAVETGKHVGWAYRDNWKTTGRWCLCRDKPVATPVREIAPVFIAYPSAPDLMEEVKRVLEPIIPVYEDWMDGFADSDKASIFRPHTFGQLRAARALMAKIGGNSVPD